MDIISREEAIKQSLKFYFTGTPCKRGHIAKRYAKGRTCFECVRHLRKQGIKAKKDRIEAALLKKQARNTAIANGQKTYHTNDYCAKCATNARYTSNNKCVACEKKYSHQYRKNSPQHIKKYNTQYYQENKSVFQELSKNYREKNRAKLIKQCSDYYYSHQKEAAIYAKQWKNNNIDRYKKQNKHYRRTHLEQHAFSQRRYKARKRKAYGSHSIEDWLWLCEKFDFRCLCCGKQGKLTEDHIRSLFCGGSDYIENIQPLCQSCNSRKHTKTISYIPIDTFLLFPSMREKASA